MSRDILQQCIEKKNNLKTQNKQLKKTFVNCLLHLVEIYFTKGAFIAIYQRQYENTSVININKKKI